MAPTLTELQRIPTSGARAVESFRVDGRDLLAIPQLALDVPGTPAGMNVGDSNTEMLILERRDGAFSSFATLPAPGGEDAEFFTIGDRHFLAVACIRTGSGPYEYRTESFIYEWQRRPVRAVPDGLDVRRQAVEALVDRRPPLPRPRPGARAAAVRGHNRNSVIFEWDGERVRRVPDHPVAVGLQLAPVRDRRPVLRRPRRPRRPTASSTRGTAPATSPHQSLLPSSGRAFAHFTRRRPLPGGGRPRRASGRAALGRRAASSPTRELEGLGARELRVVEKDGRLFLIRVNFILGTPAEPETVADLPGLRVARRRVRHRRRVPDHRRHRRRGAHRQR